MIGINKKKRKFKKSLIEDMGFDVPKTQIENWTNRKKRDKNSQKFVDWALDVLHSELKKCHYWKLRSIFKREENLAVNVLAIFMNENNIDNVLHSCIDVGTWLCYSPRLDNSLSDDEYIIDWKELMASRA